MVSIHNTLRNPAYTGENRCLPCTVLNGIIALGLAAAIGAVWVPLGTLALVIFLTLIYLRGYLVPGTPELTKRYFPAWALRAFGKDPLEGELVGQTIAGGEDRIAEENQETIGATETESLLRSAGIVKECAKEDDLCLTEAFHDAWWTEIRRYRDDEEFAATQLAGVLKVDPAEITVDAKNKGDEAADGSGRFAVAFEGTTIGRWESDAAFYADLASEPTLRKWLPAWESLTDQRRTELLVGMRAFLERCPTCEAALVSVENTHQSCCSSTVVGVSVDCECCGARVFSGSYT